MEKWACIPALGVDIRWNHSRWCVEAESGNGEGAVRRKYTEYLSSRRYPKSYGRLGRRSSGEDYQTARRFDNQKPPVFSKSKLHQSHRKNQESVPSPFPLPIQSHPIYFTILSRFHTYMYSWYIYVVSLSFPQTRHPLHFRLEFLFWFSIRILEYLGSCSCRIKYNVGI